MSVMKVATIAVFTTFLTVGVAKEYQRPLPAKCDFIIVGAGTGGAALAVRLAENPEWDICVFERGPLESGFWGYWAKGKAPYEFISPNDPNVFSTPQLYDNAGDASRTGKLIYVPRFRGVGGTSRLYGAINVRPSPEVLAVWPPGWDFDSMLPYYKKLEDHYCNYEPSEVTGISDADCAKWHGKDGPMEVNHLYEPDFKEFSVKFKEFCVDDDMPWKGYVADYNGGRKGHIGCSIFQQYSHRSDGRGNRSSGTSRGGTFTGYLNYTHYGNGRNLHIVVNTAVTKIDFDGIRAAGVHYAINGTVPGVMKALKEVIIAGGAYDTPHLLQVSGVGERKHLESLGVRVVAENKEVGEHLWDHISVPYVLQLKEKPRDMPRSPNGPFSWIVHLDTETLSKRMSDMQMYFMDNSPMFSATDTVCRPEPIAPPELQTSVRLIHQYPSYRGTVRATSASIYDKPQVDMGWRYPIPDDDLLPFQKTIDKLRELMARPGPWGDLVDKELLPGDMDLAAYLKEGMVSALHPACTCRMGACTDGQLLVKGVRNLRVCDASAFATQVDGNPAETIYAMAEKLADMLKEQWAAPQTHMTVLWQQDFRTVSTEDLEAISAFKPDEKKKKKTTKYATVGSKSTMQLPGYPVLTLVLESFAGSNYTASLTNESAASLGLVRATFVNELIPVQLAWRRRVDVVVADPNAVPAAVADEIAALLATDLAERYAPFGVAGSVDDAPRFVDAIANPSENSGGPAPGSAARPLVFVLWRQNFDTVTQPELWKTAGKWRGTVQGEISTEPGASYTFQLPGLPAMTEYIVNFTEGLQFVYRMKRSEPPGQPGVDYIATKMARNLPNGGSAWIRSASLTVDEGVDPIVAATNILNDVFVGGGRRFESTFGWSRDETLLVYQPPTRSTSDGRVAAFDLDGCIVTTKSGETFAKDSDDWQFLNEQVAPTLRALHASGAAVVILSNQGGIKDSSYKAGVWQDKVNKIMDALAFPLQVVAATGYDGFRKPKPGMWTYFVKTLSGGKGNTSVSFYCGDAAGRPGDFSNSDLKFSENAGLKFYTPEQLYFAPVPTGRKCEV
ncbi:L-sorbose 1-dehydrogenase [Diplonema papillatum]|nr:L-sorbose 1-dehydrogenase [Diplonema papillatum]